MLALVAIGIVTMLHIDKPKFEPTQEELEWFSKQDSQRQRFYLKEKARALMVPYEEYLK